MANLTGFDANQVEPNSDYEPIPAGKYVAMIRGEWHSRKDNLLLANLLSQTHVFNIDPNYPHSVGMFVAHRMLQ